MRHLHHRPTEKPASASGLKGTRLVRWGVAQASFLQSGVSPSGRFWGQVIIQYLDASVDKAPPWAPSPPSDEISARAPPVERGFFVSGRRLAQACPLQCHGIANAMRAHPTASARNPYYSRRRPNRINITTLSRQLFGQLDAELLKLSSDWIGCCWPKFIDEPACDQHTITVILLRRLNACSASIAVGHPLGVC